MKQKQTPNLVNYEKTAKDFNWESQVENLPNLGENKINAGFISISTPAQIHPSKKALIYLNEETRNTFSYKGLDDLSNKFANVLEELKTEKGDRVFFFLPRIPELYFGFLGTLKMGAIAGTLFPAFGPKALLQRLKNSQAKVLITDGDLYERVEKIRDELPDLKEVILVNQTKENCQNLKTLMNSSSSEFEAAKMDPSDPAFMLYTSGTGTTPVSGIVIPHKAIAQQKKTAQWVLDLKKDDIYWCTSDPGWVTGIVYGILAPFALGTTIVVSKDRFNAKNWFSILEKEKVSVFYSAPTAFRFLEKEDHFAREHDFSQLRHILSVGEALSPSSIKWAKKTFDLPIYDTWWQTETGAMMIANFLCLPIREGSMGKPIPGIKASIVDDQAKPAKDGEEGNLAFEPGWPSALVDIWQNRENLKHYFKNDLYYSGDRAYKDKDGYFWFIGRADDVIKTSGERVGPFEVESSLQEHESVLESAVIGKPDKQRGQIIKAFVVLKPNFEASSVLKEELQAHVKKTMAGHAYPREIEFKNNLPKTKTGKIMRRYLKTEEMGLPAGDISTLEKN